MQAIAKAAVEAARALVQTMAAPEQTTVIECRTWYTR